MSKNPIIAKYFGKAPDTVKEIVDTLTPNTPVEITETDKRVHATIQLTKENLPKGITPATLKKVKEFQDALRGVTAAATINLQQKHKDKKAAVSIDVSGIYEIEGVTLKNGRILTRVKSDISEEEQEYLADLDSYAKKLLGKDS